MGSKKFYIVAIFTQIIYAGMSLSSKVAFATGMNTKEKRPLSLKQLCHAFFISLIGITLTMNAYDVGIDYTSPTFGAAAINCIPISTFIFAVTFRMEKVNLKKASGIAKVGGMMICVGGAAILAFYKGPYLKPIISHPIFHFEESETDITTTSQKSWMLGCFILLVATMGWGIWYVFQAMFLKDYPHPVELMCTQTVMSVVQCFVVAIIVERDHSEWKLDWNVRLYAILYCGILVIGIANNAQCWVIKETGPVFPSMMMPINLVATIIGSQLFLAEGIYLGSVIGAILLVISLYSVLWGKSKELVDTPTNQDQPFSPDFLPQKESEEQDSRSQVDTL
ncbi:WAT1-related protein At5g64700 isoform X2 [Cucumis sativus]|uniref:WAT1-related protein At5g64700 isoform X2 n=1 Tax=Cucumis sativus TaxID=3659 RepID=UPI0005ED14DE|nr:WAT1-related protein At5g64700 isoform X2 [Cucumis sativus]